MESGARVGHRIPRSNTRNMDRAETPHVVIMEAFAHAVRNKVEAAYARSDLFEKRRALMESWSQYLAA